MISVQADVGKVADVQGLFETARSTFGKIDVVVVNAGVAEFFASDLSGFVSGQVLLVSGGGLA